MHYTGRLAETGRKFDLSLDRNRAFDFMLGVRKVIQGWDKGVAGMCVADCACQNGLWEDGRGRGYSPLLHAGL